MRANENEPFFCREKMLSTSGALSVRCRVGQIGKIDRLFGWIQGLAGGNIRPGYDMVGIHTAAGGR